MQEQERGDVPSAADGQRAAGQEQECERAGGDVRAANAGARAAAATGRRGAGERAQQQRVLHGEAADERGGAGGRAAEDGHSGVDVGAAEVPGHVPARAVSPAARLPGGGRGDVAADGGPLAAAAGLAGKQEQRALTLAPSVDGLVSRLSA